VHSKCSGINLSCFTLFQFKCNAREDATVLIIVLDARFEQLKPKQRVMAIKNLSGFLSLQHVCTFIRNAFSKKRL
jgi:hypothetical protein